MSTTAPTYNHAVPYKDHHLDAIQVGLQEASLSDSGSDSGPDSENDLLDCEPYDPSLCLFCAHRSDDFDASLEHMRLRHGFAVPDPARLAVDPETLAGYLHLVIAADHECLWCGSRRGSRQGAQQHMTGKNHCRIDLDREGSEYRDFYEWPAADGEDDEDGAALPGQKPVFMDDAVRLPSGKILSHRNHAKTPRIGEASRYAGGRKQGALPAGDGRQQQKRGAPAPGMELVAMDGGEDGENMSKRLAKQLQLAQTQLGKMREGDKALLLAMPPKQRRMVLLQSRRDTEYASKKRNDMLIKLQVRLSQKGVN